MASTWKKNTQPKSTIPRTELLIQINSSQKLIATAKNLNENSNRKIAKKNPAPKPHSHLPLAQAHVYIDVLEFANFRVPTNEAFFFLREFVEFEFVYMRIEEKLAT